MKKPDLAFLASYPVSRPLRRTLLALAGACRAGYSRVVSAEAGAAICLSSVRTYKRHIAALHAAGVIHVEHRRSPTAPYHQIANRITVFAPGWFASKDHFLAWYEARGYGQKNPEMSPEMVPPPCQNDTPPPCQNGTAAPRAKMAPQFFKDTTRGFRAPHSAQKKTADTAKESCLHDIDLASLPAMGTA